MQHHRRDSADGKAQTVHIRKRHSSKPESKGVKTDEKNGCLGIPGVPFDGFWHEVFPRKKRKVSSIVIPRNH